jgi:hypothetical protein
MEFKDDELFKQKIKAAYSAADISDAQIKEVAAGLKEKINAEQQPRPNGLPNTMLEDSTMNKTVTEERKGLRRFSVKTRIVAASIAAALVLGVALPLILWLPKGGLGDFLKDYSVDLTGVSAMGVQSKTAASPNAAALLSAGKPAYADAKERNYLITFDEQGNIAAVVFKAPDGGDKKQEDLPGYLYKMWVTDEFVYLQYLDGLPNWVVTSENELTFDYQSIGGSHSFVVHKASGKVYSLSSFGSVTRRIYGSIIEVNDIEFSRYYKLSVENGLLKGEEILTNRNVRYGMISFDKWGHIFVENGVFDTRDGDYIYFKPRPDQFLGKDALGNMYAVQRNNGIDKFNVQMYAEDGGLISPAHEKPVYIKQTGYDDNTAFFVYRNGYAVFPAFALFSDKDDNNYSFVDGAYDYGTQTIYRDGIFFTLRGNNLKCYDYYSLFDGDGNLIKTPTYPDNPDNKQYTVSMDLLFEEKERVSSLELAGDEAYYTVEEIGGTQYYKIALTDGGTWEREHIGSTIYGAGVIYVQPLN